MDQHRPRPGAGRRGRGGAGGGGGGAARAARASVARTGDLLRMASSSAWDGSAPAAPGVGRPGRRRDYSVRLFSRRLGVPVGLLVITLGVELLTIQACTVDEAASPYVPLYSAPTPAACGEAIEVPLMVLVPP